MLFSYDTFIRIIILILGFWGFVVAKYIRDHKTKNTPLVCPVGFDCHAVIHSDYSRFLNMPVETFGMVYYALVFSFYLIFIFIGKFMPKALVDFLILLSSVAFLFSIYLVVVQIFVLKKGCSWCIVSAVISALIFILSGISLHFLL